MKDALRRCTCPAFEPEQHPEHECVQRCKSCKGWTALEVMTRAQSAALDKLIA